QIDTDALIERIDPNKDADGLTPANIGHLWMDKHFVEPATAEGIIALLKHYEISLEGKNVVIIGRSNIVGKPLAALMLEQNATVTIAHSRTKNLGEITKKADVLVSATGQAFLVKADMVKDGAVVVDVGMNHVDGKLVGDVDFDNVKEKASYITPVPGGVGPLTVQFLMEAVVKLTRRQNDR
ncbi:bifunctional methylenetetrahydrofolate dehydrogenase/methenyltetrahydrofolate cyclohydrolase, partial [Lactobacillus helveticus]